MISRDAEGADEIETLFSFYRSSDVTGATIVPTAWEDAAVHDVGKENCQ